MTINELVDISIMGPNKIILRSIVWEYRTKKEGGEDLTQTTDKFISLFNKINRKPIDKRIKRNLLRYLVDYTFNELLEIAEFVEKNS